MIQLSSRRRLHYGWIVVAMACIADYVPAFLLAGALAVAAGVAVLFIKRNQRPALLAAA